MEVDISKKVNCIIKFGLPALLGITAIFVGIIWCWQSSNHYLKIIDAQVMGSMVNVASRTNGTIAEFVVKNGAVVKSGDPLAKVKVSITEEQIKQLEQTVDIAKKNLAKVQEGVVVTQPVYSGGGNSAAAEEAAAHLEKMEKLYAMGAISAVKRDEAAAAYELAQMGGYGGNVTYQTVIQPNSPQVIQNAELQVKIAEASLEKAKQESNATVVVAPVAGTVFYQNIKVNDEIQPGQILFNIGSAKNLWIEAYLKSEQAAKVELGQLVTYKVNGKRLKGSVLEIREPKPVNDEKTASPEAKKNADKYVVKISLIPPNDMIISPGEKVTVEIAL